MDTKHDSYFLLTLVSKKHTHNVPICSGNPGKVLEQIVREKFWDFENLERKFWILEKSRKKSNGI